VAQPGTAAVSNESIQDNCWAQALPCSKLKLHHGAFMDLRAAAFFGFGLPEVKMVVQAFFFMLSTELVFWNYCFLW
jgi:hypothetical protein